MLSGFAIIGTQITSNWLLTWVKRGWASVPTLPKKTVMVSEFATMLLVAPRLRTEPKLKKVTEAFGRFMVNVSVAPPTKLNDSPAVSVTVTLLLVVFTPRPVNEPALVSKAVPLA